MPLDSGTSHFQQVATFAVGKAVPGSEAARQLAPQLLPFPAAGQLATILTIVHVRSSVRGADVAA